MSGQRRVALVAGAVGRQGEALLNRVLGAGDYAEVVALAAAQGASGATPDPDAAARSPSAMTRGPSPSSPISLGVRGLSLATADALPALDDVFLLLSDHADAAARSFYGRDAPFEQLHADNCLAVAKRAAERGAQRAVLVSPMPAWQQVGHFHRGLSNALELAVSQLPFASLTVLRPVRTAGGAGGSLLQRFVAGYLSLQLLMLPKSVQMLTSEQLARCTLAAMRRAAPGLQVLASDALPALLEAPADAAEAVDR